jgi:hypothetical protein
MLRIRWRCIDRHPLRRVGFRRMRMGILICLWRVCCLRGRFIFLVSFPVLDSADTDRGVARVAKKLGLDYAEAITGFEFKKQRAIPVVTGIVVADGNESLVLDAWRAEETLRLEKEATKKQKEVLARWKKFLVGLRIRKRINNVYGTEGPETEEPSTTTSTRGSSPPQKPSLNRASGILSGIIGAIDNTSHKGDDDDDVEKEEEDEDTEGGFILD